GTTEPAFVGPPSTAIPPQSDVRTTSGVTGVPVPTTMNGAGTSTSACAVDTRPTPMLSTQSENSTADGAASPEGSTSAAIGFPQSVAMAASAIRNERTV